MAAVAITQAFAGITLRGSSAGKVATTPISAKAHFGGVRALGKSAFARTAKAQRLQIRAEAEGESAPEAPAAPVASTDEGDAPRPRGTFPHQRFADSLLPKLAHAQADVSRTFFSHAKPVTSRPRPRRCDLPNALTMRAMAYPDITRIVSAAAGRIVPRRGCHPPLGPRSFAFSWFRALVWIRVSALRKIKHHHRKQPLADLHILPPSPPIQQPADADADADAAAASPRATASPRTSSRCSASRR